VPFILRKVRKSRWYKSEAESELGKGDVPADPLGDLQTQGNVLSIWRIDDKKSNLDRIACAIAAGAQSSSNLDYVLLDFKHFKKLKLKHEGSRGRTLDSTINDCHIDIQGLTGKKLISLARAFLKHGEVGRMPEKDLLESIKKAIESKQIDPTKIHPEIAKKIKSDRLLPS
jgi:hypothetical protein